MDNEKQICRYCKYWVEEIFGTSKCSHGEAIIQNRGFCEQKLYISKEARQKRYSYQLVKLVESESKKAGYHKIYLETHHNLPVAKQLYEKLNYTLLQTALSGSEHSTMDIFFIKDL